MSSFFYASKMSGKRFNHDLAGPGGSPNNNFVMFFNNVQDSKRAIYKTLRGKSGVYLFINNITNDLYVGSSITLSKRMTSHFYLANSEKATNIVLARAMRKYELKSFSLGILEICASDTIVCSELEQKWMDYYKPRYNVLKVAGSSSGFRHSVDTINKLKEQFKKESHPKYGTVSSPETINAIAQGIKEFYLTHSHPSKGLKGKLSPQYGIGGKSVFCYNQKGEELIFPSINGAKQHFHVRWTLIKKSIDTGQSIYLNGEPWIIQSLPRPAR
ncbi:GIY-YIG endonuclease (mitochondrion) [Sclerotinia sclerotiorum 1980 UF-70]|uniref:GIY-YIG endonuclease n=1 Tax=Sclerotinia sclerotiorum (strain ATCC 18683 / 1980 / Ss-1) TaxID=665079 RepID=A0A0K0PSY4_SCLS1|nr:GIY-YIG endonuclease [Sclerotinia sclerotiorum 1980 UF-70]AKQ53320.1 GIY-YIG endonuclease [Sclerotinia sclerotiorum 1980 UF-70]